ncbi:hypothetical protein FRC01_014166 [Tulasnella sp. 417]|nr:hypothetical protein FRC01_014166 [Tulasnella sp. 417]
MASSSHLSGSPGAPLTLNRYFMELHNLQQRGEIKYTEDTQSAGPANARTWSCFITVDSVGLAYNRGSIQETFWHNADQKQAARDGAAKQVLLNIGFNGAVH